MTEQPQPLRESDLIEVVFEGRSVSLLVRPPEDQQPPATAEQAVAALRGCPRMSVAPQKINSIVSAASGRPALLGQVPLPPEAATWFVSISPDARAAYLVPAPSPSEVAGPELAPVTEVGSPEVEPAPVPISRAEIVEGLRAAEVTHGLLVDVLASFDPPRVLENIERIAVATPFVAGRDGHIEVGVNDEHHVPVTRKDGTVDHHATLASRFVEAGAVVAIRIPPVEGIPGVDLAGRPIEPPPVTDCPLEGMEGENTELQGDLLVATNPGRPVRNGERLDVLPVYEVAGDLDYHEGNIEFAGDVVIRGDVKPGFLIVATGSVVVRGMFEHGAIRAGGDISLQGAAGSGHHGRDGADGAAPALEAGGDIDALYLHAITIRAVGEVRAKREIVSCVVHAGRVLTAGRGRIVGGEVVAELEIAAGSLGSHQGTRTLLHVAEHRSDEALVIRATDAAYAGVRLNVSGAILDLEDDLSAGSFWELDGEVVHLDARSTCEDLVAFAEATGRKPPLPGLNAEPDATEAAAEDRPAA